MRNLHCLIILLLNIGFAAAQEEIVGLDHNYLFEIPQNVYIKDLNNSFDPFLGVWRGDFEGKAFYLKITKITHHQVTLPSGKSYFEDILVGSFKLEDLSSGMILIDNLSQVDPQLAKIQSVSYPRNGKLKFLYIDQDLCQFTASISLGLVPQGINLISYFFERQEFAAPLDCPYYQDFPIYLPSGQLILTKLN